MPYQVPAPSAPVASSLVPSQKPNCTATETDQLYTYAATLLRNGSQFEKAIAALEEVVRRDPKEFRPHLSLACAYASRAATLADAASGMRFKGLYKVSYDKELKEWQDAQKETNHRLYKTPRSIPTVIVTKDDRKPLMRPVSLVSFRP